VRDVDGHQHTLPSLGPDNLSDGKTVASGGLPVDPAMVVALTVGPEVIELGSEARVPSPVLS
jgi:hypothetical protein